MRRSRGTAGERMALYWFNKHGWEMERHQPETKTAYIDGKPHIIVMKSKGESDYIGGRPMTSFDENGEPKKLLVLTLCEVKEVRGNTMKASRLKKAQRDRLMSYPDYCRKVGIYWIDAATFEVFDFIERGSYKFKEGVR